MIDDYYSILNLDFGANHESIKKAYRSLAMQYHPDKSGLPGADQRFIKITEAYEVLRDPQRKKEYDMLYRSFIKDSKTQSQSDLVDLYQRRKKEWEEHGRNKATEYSSIPLKEPYRKLIIAVSVIIPVVVAVLFRVKIDGYDLTFLPPIYASINGLTAILLVVAVWAIKNGKRTLHERLMKTCLGLSGAFLVMYVLYHMTSDSTPYGGEGAIRYVYFFILITHILLSVIVIPVVLFTLGRALAGNFEKHKALARYTFPLWLYVAVTGVIVYLMISPYYPS